MPIYEYRCETHGTFTEMRPMAEYADPCPCPDCGKIAPRVMLTVPRLGLLEVGQRRAHETNERAADSPKRLSSHGPGRSSSNGGKSSRETLKRADGAKSVPASRPWMISP